MQPHLAVFEMLNFLSPSNTLYLILNQDFNFDTLQFELYIGIK